MAIRQSSDISLEPELNPLHNPILAENLDLWARVYASVPLEERSNALRQLLADLRGGRSTTALEADLASAAPAHVHDFACRQCGKLNEGGQKFCGFCGAETLSANNPDAKISGPAYKSPDANSVPTPFPDLRSNELDPRNDLKPNDVKPNNDSPFPSLQPAATVGSRQLDSLRELSFSTIYDAEESPRNVFRYTIVALVVIVCLGAVSYVQWRPQMRAAWTRIMVMAGAAPATSTSASSLSPTNAPVANANPSTTPDANSNASTPSTSPASPSTSSSTPTTTGQTATPTPAANSQPATPSVTTQPDDAAASNQNQPASPANAPAVSAEQTADTETLANAPARTQTAKAITPHRPLTQAAHVDRISSASPVDNGSAELATAQGYLNGTNGARNSAQAATWLWKAVGKQNPTALVLLSDLYARGDGVSKNCDQARMLLVAAARKNAPDAGAKLRFLESNGCR